MMLVILNSLDIYIKVVQHIEDRPKDLKFYFLHAFFSLYPLSRTPAGFIVLHNVIFINLCLCCFITKIYNTGKNETYKINQQGDRNEHSPTLR